MLLPFDREVIQCTPFFTLRLDRRTRAGAAGTCMLSERPAHVCLVFCPL